MPRVVGHKFLSLKNFISFTPKVGRGFDSITFERLLTAELEVLSL